MAKFTKLNIGGSVASSGGRAWKKLSAESAEEEVTLEGTWAIHSTISSIVPINEITSVKYNASPKLYKTFSGLTGTRTRDGTSYVYEFDEISCVSVYNNGGNYGNMTFNKNGGGMFSYVFYPNNNYNCPVADNDIITIIGYSNSKEHYDELLAWLKANATKTA